MKFVCLAIILSAAGATTIVDVAQGTGSHTVLVEALTKANLVDTLNGTGPFTVFAPTDSAFTTALTELGITKQQLLDRTDLADILKYHVLSGKTMSSALTASQSVATLQGAKVTITKSSSGVSFAGASVTGADNSATNGVVHVIDKVVLPPTVVSIAQGTGSHTVLVEALTKANLVATLNGAGPFTVFAPTDSAFTNALSALNITKQQLLDRTDLADILKYHVLSGKTMSSALTASESVATLQGAKVTITKSSSGVSFADASVTGADNIAGNGVVHVIDKVVLPPTVVGIAQSTGSHTVLVEALTKANLVATLNGAGPFTVFAPTDAAFTNALTALGITKQQLLDRTDLADILKYHVLSGKTMSSALTASQSVATLQGATVTITKQGQPAQIKFADASVSAGDVVAGNGVVHVIDTVVFPPAAGTTPAGGEDASDAPVKRITLVAAAVIGTAVFGF